MEELTTDVTHPATASPPPRTRRRIFSFTLLVWGFVGAALVAAIIWPLVAGAVANYSWTRLPCVIRDRGDMYFYVVKDTKYYSERLDFWDTFHTLSHVVPTENTLIQPNGTCYVKPGDPMTAVLYADTSKRLEGGVRRTMAWVLLTIVAAIITIKVKRKGSSSHRV